VSSQSMTKISLLINDLQYPPERHYKNFLF
jgi:hypothetical protein